jgi:hypothetical protein
MADKVKLNLALEFTTDQDKKDFEAAFYGWLKQYQQTVTIQNSILSTEEGISFYANFLPGI